MLFLLLLLPGLAWASPRCVQKPMSSVMLIVNVEDTLATGVYAQDADGDGIKVWNEAINVLDSIADVRNEQMCYVCSVMVKYSSHNANYPQAIHIDGMYYEADRDTSLGWSELPGESPAVTSTADYLQKQIQQCRQAAYVANGEYPQFYATLGLPRIIRPNSEAPYTVDALQNGSPSLNNANILVKSVPDFIEIFTPANGDTAIPNASFTGGWYSQAGSYAYMAKTNKAKRGFSPGTYYNARYTTTAYDDTLEQQVIVTSLDAISDDATCDLIRKAYRGMGQAWDTDGTPNYYGIFQGTTDSSGMNDPGANWYYFSLHYSYPGYSGTHYKTANLIAKNLRTAFSDPYTIMVGAIDSLFFPIDTLYATAGGVVDLGTVYLGYGGARTLPAGKSAVFYHTCGSYFSSAIPTNYISQTDIPLADGSFWGSEESWNVYTWGPDTSLRSGTEDDQGLIMDAIDPNGMNATCAVGNAREVTAGVTAASSYYVPIGMYTPNMNFAEVSEMAFGKTSLTDNPTKGLNIAIGWPLMYWRPGLTALNERAVLDANQGNCNEILTWSGDMPSSGIEDSLNFWIRRENGAITDSTFNISSGQTGVTFTTGTRWISNRIVECIVSIVDTQGYYHSWEFITP